MDLIRVITRSGGEKHLFDASNIEAASESSGSTNVTLTANATAKNIKISMERFLEHLQIMGSVGKSPPHQGYYTIQEES